MVPPTPNFYIPLIERDRPLMPGNNIHFKRFNINPTYCFKWPPLQTIMQHLHHCMQAQGWERRRSCRTASAVWPWCCCSGVQLLCCCNLQTHDFPQQCRCCAARYCACKHTFVHSAAGAVLQGAVHARCWAANTHLSTAMQVLCCRCCAARCCAARCCACKVLCMQTHICPQRCRGAWPCCARKNFIACLYMEACVAEGVIHLCRSLTHSIYAARIQDIDKDPKRSKDTKKDRQQNVDAFHEQKSCGHN